MIVSKNGKVYRKPCNQQQAEKGGAKERGRVIGHDEHNNEVLQDHDGQVLLITPTEKLPVKDQKLVLRSSKSDPGRNVGQFIGFDQNKNRIFKNELGLTFLLTIEGKVIPLANPEGRKRLGEDEKGNKFFFSNSGSKILLETPLKKKLSDCQPLELKMSEGKWKIANNPPLAQHEVEKSPIVLRKVSEPEIEKKESTETTLLGVYPSGSRFYENRHGEIFMMTEDGTKIPLQETNMESSDEQPYNPDSHKMPSMKESSSTQYFKIKGRMYTIKGAANEPKDPLILLKPAGKMAGLKFFEDEEGNRYFMSKEGEKWPLQKVVSPENDEPRAETIEPPSPDT